MKEIAKGIYYVGVSDREIDLFEGQYTVPNGMAYNSYVVVGEKTAVFDTVDEKFGDEWMSEVKKVLGEKKPDYLIVQHMEPDHSSNVTKFAEEYPEAVIVASIKAFPMMKSFFGVDYADRRLVVADGDKLDLGGRVLTFLTAPMVHWPEVIVTYDEASGTIFSADGFGKFGAFDVDEDWACEARRYYFGIVGKYGVQVQGLLKKITPYEIKRICPLHGPILEEDIGYYVNLYNVWSSYEAEKEGVVIAYASIYGHTKTAAQTLAEELKKAGCDKVSMFDLTRDDVAEAIEDAFKYEKLALASVTYNGTIFPCMRNFIEGLIERNYQKRTVAFIENGTWTPMATKTMKGMLERCKNLTFAATEVKIRSALDSESKSQIVALAQELAR